MAWCGCVGWLGWLVGWLVGWCGCDPRPARFVRSWLAKVDVERRRQEQEKQRCLDQVCFTWGAGGDGDAAATVRKTQRTNWS